MTTEHATDHATDAEEEYLQSMFWLEEAGLPITGANIARAMQLSPPTVHEMLGRLEDDGYVTRGDDRSVSFTDRGRENVTVTEGAMGDGFYEAVVSSLVQR